jgi:hypothetical protein
LQQVLENGCGANPSDQFRVYNPPQVVPSLECVIASIDGKRDVNPPSSTNRRYSMAILVPIAYSTYADATTTEGGPLCKYVLAQVRSDANLSWVADVKRALGVDELKWKVLREYRPRLEPVMYFGCRFLPAG